MNNERKTVELAVKLYSQEAADLLTAFFNGVDRSYDHALQMWRDSRWSRAHSGSKWITYNSYGPKPAKPHIYSTFERGILGIQGDVQLLAKEYSRNLYRFTNGRAATTIGWMILHALPKSCLSDIKLRAELPVGDYFTTGSEMGKGKEVSGAKLACLAELLIGRKPERLAKAYGKEMVDALVGKPQNMLVVQRRMTIAAEIASLKQEKEDKVKKLDEDHNTAIYNLSKAHRAEVSAVEEDYKKQISELEAQMAAALK